MPDVLKSETFLSPEKRRLLQLVLKKKGIGEAALRSIPRRGDSEPLLASFLQEGLWFIDQFDPGKATYNVPGATRLSGRLDVGALERTLAEIVRRHESLRTTFVQEKGRPLQVIQPAKPVSLPVTSLEKLKECDRETEVVRLATEEAQRPFDLEKGPLFRAFLVRLAEEEHVLVFNIHHIVTDGWSMGVFTRELVQLYHAYSNGRRAQSSLVGRQRGVLPELPIQYPDFAIWQRHSLQGARLEQLLTYWKKQLRGPLPRLELPTDRPRPPFQTSRGQHVTFSLSKSSSHAFRTFTQREDCTLFVALLTAFKVLLSYCSGQTDIIVGSPVASRNRRELEGLIGYFVNMLPLRTKLSGNPNFRGLLSRVARVTQDAYAHEDLPFCKLVEELQIERDPSRNPVFQAEFILLTPEHAPAVYGYGFRSPIKESLELAGGLTLAPVEIESGVAKFDLVVLLWDSVDGISGTFEYNADLFDASTLHLMMKRFEALLNYVVAHPDATLQELNHVLDEAVSVDQDNKRDPLKRSSLKKISGIRRRSAATIQAEE